MIREGNITIITGKDGEPQSKIIKPCPFCGGKPEIITKGMVSNTVGIIISCLDCEANITSISNSEKYTSDKMMTINKWNRRTIIDVCKDFDC